MNEIMDEKFEIAYTDYLKTTKNPYGYSNMSIAVEEMLGRFPGLATSSDSNYKVDNITARVKTVLQKNEDKEYSPLNTGLSQRINTYVGDDKIKTVNNVGFIGNISRDDVSDIVDAAKDPDEAKRAVVLEVFQHGVKPAKRTPDISKDIGKAYKIYSGDNVFLPGNVLATVKWKGGNKLSFTLVSDENGTVSEERDIDVQSSQASLSVINEFVDKLKKVFPNIKVVSVTNVTTKVPGAKGYVRNGVVYLNRDLISLTTPIHEFGHIYTAILRSSNPDLWNKLRQSAEILLNSNDPMVAKIAAAYKDYSNEMLIEEVIVHIMSYNTLEQLQNDYSAFDNNNAESLAKGFWESFKDIIKNAWNSIFKAIRSALNISDKVSLAHDNLMDLSKKVVGAMNSGQVLSTMTSAEAGVFMYGTQEEKITIDTPKDLINTIYTTGDETIEDIQNKESQLWIISIIRGNEMKFPAHITGTEVSFEDDELKFNNSKILAVKKEVDAKNTRIATGIKTALTTINSKDASPGSQNWIDKVFGTTKETSNVTVPMFNRMLASIGHVRGKEYLSLKDFIDNYGLAGSIPVQLISDDIIVSMDYSDEKSIVISLVDTKTGLNQHLTSADKILSGVIDKGLLTQKGIVLKKTSNTRSGLSMAMLANTIVSKNKKISVREIGRVRLWKGGERNYFNISLTNMNNQLLKLGQIPEFQKMITDNMKKYFDPKYIKNQQFNYAVYLKELWDEYGLKGGADIINSMRTIDTLLPFEQIKLLRERLREVINEYMDAGGHITFEQRAERDVIIDAIRSLKMRNVDMREVNSEYNITGMEKWAFDANSIGNEEIHLVRSVVLRSSEKIVDNVNKKKKILHNALDKWMKLQGATKYTVANRSKKLFQRLFDVTVDAKGNVYRTGAIRHNDKPTKDMDPMERALAERTAALKGAEKLSKEELAVGKALVDLIDVLMRQNIVHYHKMKHFGKTTWKLTEEQIENEIKESSYYRGWIPMMDASAAEKFAEAKFKGSFKKRVIEVSDLTNLFEDNPNYKDMVQDEMLVKSIRDNMFSQTGWREASTNEYGSMKRVRDVMGLREDIDANNNPIWIAEDEKKNQGMSYNIEQIMNYLILATERNTVYEDEVLPVMNGVLLYLQDRNLYEGVDVGNAMDYIRNYRAMAVLGKKNPTDLKIGKIDIPKVANVIDMIFRPIVMTLNVNVAFLSMSANAMYGYIDGWANSIAKNDYFSGKDLAKATKLYLSDNGLVKQMALEYHVANMTEYDLLHNQTQLKADKRLISDFTSNYMNWFTDQAARTVVMVAQMLKDGSFYAHSLDEDGNMVYDEKKDRRFFNEQGKQTAEQKVLYKTMKERQLFDGFDSEKKLSRGYDRESAGTFKALSDMYVVGSFDNKVGAYLGNFQLGRSFLMLSNWFISRFTSAVGTSGKYKHEGGILKTVKDADGKIIAKWERISTEGYLISFWNAIGTMISSGITPGQYWARAESFQKKNIAKAGLTIAVFAALKIMYEILVNKPGDDDDDKPIPEITPVKTFGYLVDQLFILPVVYDMIDQPFAGLSILSRGVFGLNGDIDYRLLRNWIPARKTFEYGEDIYDLTLGEGEWGD